MLKITPEQHAALTGVAFEGFAAKAAAYLAMRHPGRVPPPHDPAAARRVREGAERARAAGLQNEAHVVAFLEAELLCGQGFDGMPPHAAVLRSDADAHVKMDHLERVITAWQPAPRA